MKMNSLLNTTFASVVLMFTACSNPAPAPKAVDMDAAKTEIQAMEDAYAAGEAAKDADAVAAYYSTDAVSYTRNKEPLVGKEAIKNAIAERLAKDTTGTVNVYKVVDLYAEGDLAVEIGSWNENTPAGVEVEHGYYMSIFKKVDGKYTCIRDMNVTSKPLSAIVDSLNTGN
jgi:uncharacterized protein (TIGR02246 family)